MDTHIEEKLEAVSDPTRRLLLERLRHGPRTVGDLASDLPVSRPAVSQHLRILKQAHLVHDQAVGTRRYYRLDPHGFADIQAYFNSFWSEALNAFKTKVEEK